MEGRMPVEFFFSNIYFQYFIYLFHFVYLFIYLFISGLGMLKTFPPVCVCVCAWHEICHTLKVVTGVLYEKNIYFSHQQSLINVKCHFMVVSHMCNPAIQLIMILIILIIEPMLQYSYILKWPISVPKSFKLCHCNQLA